jgi:carbohydrate kinase (thermoresistant glucokinase family)
MVLILMGPTGCGKTTVGHLLAQRLGWPFLDGDNFHPAANVAKMHNGTPLNDSDRRPWLLALQKEIERRNRARQSAILACSALKKTYRELLGVDQQAVKTVYLRGSFELLQERLADRRGHFMPPKLLRSQLETLEVPKGGLVVDIDEDPAMIVTRIIASLQQAALSGKTNRNKTV